MTVREMKKRLVGRKIVGFEAGAFRDGELSPKQHQKRPSSTECRTCGKRLRRQATL